MKKIIIALCFQLIALQIIGQSCPDGTNADPFIYCLIPAGSITVGSNVNVNITVGNNSDNTTIRENTLRVLVSAGCNAIIPVQTIPGWTVVSNSVTSIILRNQNVIGLLETPSFNIVFTGIVPMSPCSYDNPSTVSANVSYRVGNFPAACGGQTYGSQGDDPGTVNNNASGSITVTNSVLPVDFISINAVIKNCATQIDWKVANQISLKHYELESSMDGINFTTGKTIPLNSQNAYAAEMPVSGNNTYFYRVKAVDLDGKYKYSSITSVKANCDGKQGAFIMYPNPVLKGKQVILSSTTNESTMYRILDMAGKTIQEGRFTGNTTFQINTGGTYIIDLQSLSASTKYKLVVQ